MKEKKILKYYFFYFLVGLLICLVGLSQVFAESYIYDDIGYFTDQSQIQVEVNYANSPLTIGLNQHVQLEQVTSLDIFINNLNLTHDFIYYFEIYLPNTILTRANMSLVTWYGDNNATGNCAVISTYFSNNYPHVTFKCNGSTNIKSLYIKYYNSSNQYLFDTQQFYWNYTFMRRRTPSSNDNTGEIKDALNQQTQDILNNQNENTNKEIESQKVCTTTIIDKTYIKTDNKYLNSNGGGNSNTNFGITDYIELSPTSVIKVIKARPGSAVSYCFYDSNKNKISCEILGTNPSVGDTYTIPNNTKYVRFSINKNDNNPQYEISGVCLNGNQAITNSVNNLDNTLNNDDVDTSDAESFFNNFNDNTHGLSGIISAPLVAINQLLSNQCSPLSATWRGQNVSLPCGYDMWNRFSSFKQFLNIVIDGLLSYRILLKLFKLIEKFKNPNDDRVEVMDL